MRCVVRFAPPIVIRRYAPLTALLFAAITALSAADAPQPALSAQNTRLTAEESVFTGEARLVYEGVVLAADEIVYRPGERLAIARGNVVLTRADQRLVAEEIRYNLDERSYTVGRFRVGQSEVFAEGREAAGTNETLAISDASVTYGEPDPLTPVVRAGKMTYSRPADQPATIRFQQNRLALGKFNFFPLPNFQETPENPALDGFEFGAGFSGRVGAYLDLTLSTPVASGVSVGANLGLYSKRGALLGPVASYDTFAADGTGARGKLRTGFIKDQGDSGFDILARPIEAERGFVAWQHHQVFSPGLTLSGELNYWSDSDIIRDFRPDDFYDVQSPDSWLEAAYASDNYIVSVFGRVQPNDFSVVQERLPEIRFDGLPVDVGAGFYHRINAGVAYLREDPTGPGPKISSQRADLYYGVNRPFSPREWFSVTPVAGARVTHYERTPAASTRGNYTRVLGEVGFDAKAFEHSATWDYQNKRWGINGLRHIATPNLSYRRTPSADVGRAHIPAIDDDVFNTYLRPLGIADPRNIDRLPATNTLRLGYDHVLQTRDSVYASRDLVRLSLAADQHLSSEAAASNGVVRNRTDLHSFLAITPVRWLRYDLYNRTVAQTGKIVELNTGLTFRDADIWSFRLGTHFLDDAVKARIIEQYTADLTRRFNEIYSARISLRYDSREGIFTEQNYVFQQRLSRFWLLSYVFTIYDGNRREDNLGFSVRVETTTF